jgi:GTP-binding protein HflX
MIIVDASDPEHPAQLEVTENLLAELGAGGKPCLIVYNKCDLPAHDEIPLPAMESSDGQRRTVFISALTGRGLDKLGEQLESLVNAGKKRVKFIIPNSAAGALNTLYKNATVEDVDYGAENITVIATVDTKIRGMLSAYDGGEVH